MTASNVVLTAQCLVDHYGVPLNEALERHAKRGYELQDTIEVQGRSLLVFRRVIDHEEFVRLPGGLTSA